MARYPEATWLPVPWANARDDNTEATIALLHVTASLAQSQYQYFLTSRKACSHFHIALDGDTEQYIDTDKISAADYEGSDNAISIETAGLGEGEWTPAQVISIIKLLVWLYFTHDIPLKLKDTSDASPGVAWHRLGIIGNFPPLPSILAGRNQRGYAGEPWSLSTGKVCPGTKRIQQMPHIITESRRLAAGEPLTGGFMADLTEAQQEEVYDETTGKIKDGDRWLDSPREAHRVEIALLRRIEKENAERNSAERARDAEQRREIAGLTAAVQTLAANQGLPVDQMMAEFREAIKGISITVSA